MPPIRVKFTFRFVTVEKQLHGPFIDPLAAVAQTNNRLLLIMQMPIAVLAEFDLWRINIAQQGENAAI